MERNFEWTFLLPEILTCLSLSLTAVSLSTHATFILVNGMPPEDKVATFAHTLLSICFLMLSWVCL
jgi:hypothetical protein